MEKRFYRYFITRLKTERIAQGLSQNQFSNIANISKGYLSKIENLQFEIDDELMRHAFSKLNIKFIYDEATITEQNKQLDEFYVSLVFYDIEKAEQLYQEIDNNKDIHINSVLVLKYYLYSFIWYCIHKNDATKTEELLSILEKDIRNHIPFDNKELQIFLDTMGYYYMNQHNYKQAIQLLKRAIALGNNQHSYEMACYHLANVLAFDNNLVDAMDYAKRALNEFTKELNFKRQWFTQTHIANIYGRIKQYEQAEEIYQNMLKYYSNIDNGFMWDRIKTNLCWVLVLEEKYTDALDCIFNSQNDIVHPMDFFHIALCYFKLHKTDEAMNWIMKGKPHYIKDFVVFERLKVLEILINEKDDIKIFNFIKESYSITFDKLDYEGNKFYLELLIEYCEKTFRYKEALDYLKKLNQL